MKADGVPLGTLGTPRFGTVLQPLFEPVKHVHKPLVRGGVETSDRVESRIDGRLELSKWDKVERDDLVRVRLRMQETVIRNGRVGEVRKGLPRPKTPSESSRSHFARSGTHRHADECIWDTGWSTERVTQQSIQVVHGVEQPPVHVQFERGQTVRLSRLVMQPVVDRSPTGESDQEPDACERARVGRG